MKKNIIIRTVIMLVLIALLIPTFSQRVKNENANNDVIFALNYNNAKMVLNNEEFYATLSQNKGMGVNTLLVAEESINSLINAGYITGIKYNVLCHKYDDESEEIIKMFEGDDKIHNDSYVLITKRPAAKEYLSKWIPSKYSATEYVKRETPLGADVYILYEGIADAWKVTTGFDEEKIAKAHYEKFDIILSMMVGGFKNTEYVNHIAELVEKYDIRFLNLKENFNNEDKTEDAKRNEEAICDLIKSKGLYVVLTENQDQLSNQKPIGYESYVKAANGKVLRSYETIDFDNPPYVETRYHQITNSVVDRNIRLVVINQLVSGSETFRVKSDMTNKATKMALDKLNEIGYNTDEYDTVFNYNVNRRLVSAVAMIIMILMGITLLELLFGKKLKKLEIVCCAGALLSIPFSFKAPEGIVALYPTLFAAVAPCFAFTLVMTYVKTMKEKQNWIVLTVTTSLFALVTLSLCGLVQSSLLSGLDYYINSLIFRGIKISLILPVLYSALAYAVIFSQKKENYISKTIDILNMNVKVYWMIVAAFIGGIVAIYLIRSGNVSEISSAEAFMRNTITEFMTARPRTKEFLVGWPCLMLFVYYLKNINVNFFSWILAVGSSILFASVINSFCHVFTAAEIIFSRVMNGLLIAVVVGVFALVINAVIVKFAKHLQKKYF